MSDVEQATYIALKRLKVHELNEDGSNRIGADGRPVMRTCIPGDLIPEATTWSNLWREVRAGRVGLAGTALTGPSLADSMRRRIADRATRPKSGPEAAAGRTREGRKRRAKQSRESQAADAAVEQATGQEVVDKPETEDVAPQAVEASDESEATPAQE